MERARRADLARLPWILLGSPRLTEGNTLCCRLDRLTHIDCHLYQALTPEFAQLLSQLLYNQTELRPAVLRALRTLVESNLAIAAGSLDKLPETVRADVISSEDAENNVQFLRGQAESWLAVLFNVFSSVGRDSQGMVGDVISVWAGIANEQVGHTASNRAVY